MNEKKITLEIEQLEERIAPGIAPGLALGDTLGSAEGLSPKSFLMGEGQNRFLRFGLASGQFGC